MSCQINNNYHQQDEPFWATAKRNNLSFAAFLWGRCDIPYDAEKRFRYKNNWLVSSYWKLNVPITSHVSWLVDRLWSVGWSVGLP